MTVVREVFQVKWGKADEFIAFAKDMNRQLIEPEGYKTRVLSDASGAFFVIVMETEFPNLGEYERVLAKWLRSPQFPALFARMSELVESGSREFWTVEG